MRTSSRAREKLDPHTGKTLMSARAADFATLGLAQDGKVALDSGTLTAGIACFPQLAAVSHDLDDATKFHAIQTKNSLEVRLCYRDVHVGVDQAHQVDELSLHVDAVGNDVSFRRCSVRAEVVRILEAFDTAQQDLGRDSAPRIFGFSLHKGASLHTRASLVVT